MSFYDSTREWRRHLTEEQGSLVLEFLKRTEALTEPPPGVPSGATPRPTA